MRQSSRKCPICGKTKVDSLHHQSFELPSDHPFQNGYDVVCCNYCGFVFADISMTQAKLDDYYSHLSKYEDSHTSTGSGLSPFDNLRFKEAVKIITSTLSSKNGKIIDIGCANGGFLQELSDAGYTDITGLDPSINCVENTKRFVKCKAFVGSISDFPHSLGKFDCLLFSHVLEHVYDLDLLGIILDSLLLPEGIVYVEVPDAQHYSENVTSPFQEFNTEHINHFSASSLKNLFSKFGYICVFESNRNILVGDGTNYPVVSCVFKKTNEEIPIIFDKNLQNEINIYILKSQKLLQMINDKVHAIIKNHPNIIIWGTGQLTMKLLAETCLKKANIYCFIDGNPVNFKKRIAGKEIFPPTYLHNCPNYPILISTLLHQSEIINTLHEMELTNITLTLE